MTDDGVILQYYNATPFSFLVVLVATPEWRIPPEIEIHNVIIVTLPKIEYFLPS
jgi:hypothetical protein